MVGGWNFLTTLEEVAAAVVVVEVAVVARVALI